MIVYEKSHIQDVFYVNIAEYDFKIWFIGLHEMQIGNFSCIIIKLCFYIFDWLFTSKKYVHFIFLRKGFYNKS